MKGNLCFIGFGSMAQAIAQGLAKENYILSAAAPSLTEGVNKNRIHTFSNNRTAIKDANVIILAIKPPQVSTVLKDIGMLIPKNCLLISIAAGPSLPWIAQYCSKEQAIIRAMPNTPASIGLGATALIANSYAAIQQKDCAEHIFSRIGLTTWLETETDMDSITAFSGSGPAYFFSFLESFIEAGVALGLTRKLAKQFALQTCKGALELTNSVGLELADLRKKVTSPGGTTEAALTILQKPLEQLLIRSMHAAKKRSQELGQQIN
jgi:pyrroline-5-carboxylate reductase